MRLKYYLRGAGIGMIVTAIILAVAMNALGYEKRIYEETGAQEKILGEKFESESLDNVDENLDVKIEHLDENVSDKPETVEANPGTPSDVKVTDVEPEKETQAQDSTLEEQDNDDTDADNNQGDNEASVVQEPAKQTIKFVISGGQYSEQVSKNLESAGLIDDASKFNEYICDTGYDNYLQPGNYDIPLESTYEEIANILTKKR